MMKPRPDKKRKRNRAATGAKATLKKNYLTPEQFAKRQASFQKPNTRRKKRREELKNVSAS